MLRRFFLKILKDQYHVFLQIDGAQQVEIEEPRQAGDVVQRQVKNLQTLQILQPFNPLQLVSPLDTEQKENTFKEASM